MGDEGRQSGNLVEMWRFKQLCQFFTIFNFAVFQHFTFFLIFDFWHFFFNFKNSNDLFQRKCCHFMFDCQIHEKYSNKLCLKKLTYQTLYQIFETLKILAKFSSNFFWTCKKKLNFHIFLSQKKRKPFQKLTSICVKEIFFINEEHNFQQKDQNFCICSIFFCYKKFFFCFVNVFEMFWHWRQFFLAPNNCNCPAPKITSWQLMDVQVVLTFDIPIEIFFLAWKGFFGPILPNFLSR